MFMLLAAAAQSGITFANSPPPAIVAAPPNQGTFQVVPYNGPQPPKGSDAPLQQLRIRVTFQDKELWAGTLGIRGPYSASYGENLRSGSDERCPPSAMLNDLAYSLSVSLRHEGGQSGTDDDFRVNVNYNRSYRDEDCKAGSRQIVLEAPLHLAPGEVRKVTGDGGLVATVERLRD